jgi:hypothetical protein
MEVRSQNHCCHGKQSVLHISVFVLACAWVRASRARKHEHGRALAYLSSMPGTGAILAASSLAPPYFQHYLINGMIFGKKSLNIKCVFFLQILFETLLILRKIQLDIVINVKPS